jgi:hypothetical protein
MCVPSPAIAKVFPSGEKAIGPPARTADAENHRPMPADERFESGLISLPDEALQQLAVRQPAAVFEKHSPTKAVQNMIGAARSHDGDSREEPSVRPITYCWKKPRRVDNFSKNQTGASRKMLC